MTESIKTPMPDTAEWNAFFPSPYSLSVYTAAKTDFDGVKYDFPDSLDEGANIAIGYMPGRLKKLVGKNLAALGVKILNSDITGKVHRDRTLLTGDSPLASNALGKLAAETLLAEVK